MNLNFFQSQREFKRLRGLLHDHPLRLLERRHAPAMGTAEANQEINITQPNSRRDGIKIPEPGRLGRVFDPGKLWTSVLTIPSSSAIRLRDRGSPCDS